MTDLELMRKDKDDFFATDKQSPLTEEQKANFSGLHYFPENPALTLRVTVQPFAEKEPIAVQTSTGDMREYQRYGSFEFEVEGQTVSLTIYETDFGYFLPFVDSLAGAETYPAGRYVEPEDLGGGEFLIDFNQTYNPYCAYNDKWSCPLTPFENKLKVPIRAGEKNFK